ncbi:MAG TPA: allantoinase AllB [Pyrinomonadaceae bacterium]|nr:allantoinase AllB [Pyrinomonadaceae bacterium]
MPPPELAVRGRRVVTNNSVGPASIHVSGGRITAVADYDEVPPGCPVYDAGGRVVMAGLVDSHVHVNEPGRTHWEGFESATRAAAAGGVTTIVDMPLNSVPPTTTAEGLRRKLEAARGRCGVDVGFWGGVVPGNLEELPGLFDAGVVGFKCFLIHSGVEEFPHVTESELRPAMKGLARMGAPLIAHAELPGPVEEALAACCAAGADGADPRRYDTFLRSRPREAEDAAIALLVRLCRETGARTHVVHHSSADSLQLIERAKSEGLPFTAETCPHYLAFAAEDVPDGATEFKCCPPVRERENNERLWGALAEGVIDMVVSDHSPCPPEMKCRGEGDFLRAWGGISSLQLRLPVVWEHARRRGHTHAQLARWLAEAPAELTGFGGRKGRIAPGYDADLVVWDDEATFRVEPALLHHRHKLTPYEGQTLAGVVEATFLRGEKIYERGGPAGEPRGELLRRS